MRYLNGDYHREDSRLIRSAKPWQLTHSWTTEQDMPSGRFRVIAYSPKKGVDWSVRWQETDQKSLGALIPKIVETLEAAKSNLRRLMDAEDTAEAKRKKEREEEWERYERREDARKAAQALSDSRQQLADGRLVILGTKGTIELRKYVDIAGKPGTDHVFLVDGKTTRHFDAWGEKVTYFEHLLADVRGRSETTMPQEHVFTVCRLALEAQAQATVLTTQERKTR